VYFASRLQAGRMLASQIVPHYSGEDTAIVALSDGGVVVGTQIAIQLRAVVTMLLVDEIELPRELVAVAGISQDGSFSYNSAFAPSEIEEMVSEYRSVIEQEKLEKLHKLHNYSATGGLIRHDLLENRNIILVSDGIPNAFLLDLAMEYLKPVPYKKLIIATPLASVAAVDRMHLMADDIYCLSTLEDYMDTDHYYDAKDVPDHGMVIATVAELIKNWTKYNTP
jgi:putative phosphoribosyl transferase